MTDSTTKGSENILSVVVPVYRSASILPSLHQRLTNTLSNIGLSWEIIYVDDLSPDDSWEKLLHIYSIDKNTKIIRFSHNHGQQVATICGLAHAKGNFVITIDDDLQCHPEDIPAFIDKLQSGYHAVIGKIQSSRKKHAWWRNFGSRTYGYIISKVLKKPPHLSLSSFRGFSRTAVNSITSYKGVHPHIAALMLRSIPVKHIVNVEIQHSPRQGDLKSTYTIPKLIKTASYIIINQSYAPLRFVIIWGAFVSALSILFAVAITLRSLVYESPVAGWASLATLISFLCGNILFALGVIGEYVGRLVEENSKFQQYTIFETKGYNAE